MRRRFVARLPRPVRWLWFAILGVVAVELIGLALGPVLGDAWLSAAIQLSSILVGPLALGLLIVAAASVWVGREPARRAAARSDHEHRPAPPATPPVPVEVAAARRAGEAVTALARSREGKAAIRQTARLVRAVRAAAQPAPESTGANERERHPGGEPPERGCPKP